MRNRVSADEWDILIYVASYISGYGTRPAQEDLEQANLSAGALACLLRKRLLVEIDNGLEPVLQATNRVRNVA